MITPQNPQPVMAPPLTCDDRLRAVEGITALNRSPLLTCGDAAENAQNGRSRVLRALEGFCAGKRFQTLLYLLIPLLSVRLATERAICPPVPRYIPPRHSPHNPQPPQ